MLRYSVRARAAAAGISTCYTCTGELRVSYHDWLILGPKTFDPDAGTLEHIARSRLEESSERALCDARRNPIWRGLPHLCQHIVKRSPRH